MDGRPSKKRGRPEKALSQRALRPLAKQRLRAGHPPFPPWTSGGFTPAVATRPGPACCRKAERGQATYRIGNTAGWHFFCGAKKNAAGPPRGRGAHGRQRNAGKREAHFCPKGMAERKGGGNTWKTYRHREAARPCAEQEQKAARKGNSKEEKQRLLPCEGQNQPTPSRRKIAGTPQFSGHKNASDMGRGCSLSPT